MSQYINFFVRNENDFIPIAEYSRNNETFQLFLDFAPWEKVRCVSNKDLDFFSNQLKEKILENKKYIKEKKKIIEKIGDFNNNIEEKLDYIESYSSCIEGYEETIDELVYTLHFILFLSEINYQEKASVYVGYEIYDPEPDQIIV